MGMEAAASTFASCARCRRGDGHGSCWNSIWLCMITSCCEWDRFDPVSGAGLARPDVVAMLAIVR